MGNAESQALIPPPTSTSPPPVLPLPFPRSLTNELDLAEKDLACLPPELASATELTSLDISWNNITDISSLENKRLQKLYASWNKIESIEEYCTSEITLSTNNTPFFQLSQLRRLDLRCNKLHEIPPSIVNFQLLTYLDLSNNNLQILTSRISDLTSLTYLNVSRNNLENLPENIGKLSSLKTLEVHYNKLSELPPSTGNLSSLTHLQFSGNKLENLPENIGKLSSLKTLEVHYNKLSELPRSIGNLSSITHLDASLNNLYEVPSEIGQLTQLKILYLKSNKLHKINPAIGKLVKLEDLSLQHNQLRDLPRQFANLTNLTKLNLKYNPWQNPAYSSDSITDVLKFIKTKFQYVELVSSAFVKFRMELLEKSKKLMQEGRIVEAKSFLTVSDDMFTFFKRENEIDEEEDNKDVVKFRDELSREIEEREKLTEYEVQVKIERRIAAIKEEIMHAEQQASKARSEEEREMIKCQLSILQQRDNELKEQLQAYETKLKALEERESTIGEREKLIGEQAKQIEELLEELSKMTNAAPDASELQQQMHVVVAGDKDVDSARRRFEGLQKQAKEAQKKLVQEEKRQRERVEWLQKQMDLYRVKGMSPGQLSFRNFLKDIKRLSTTRRNMCTPIPLCCFISYAWEKDPNENKELQKKLQKIKSDLEVAGMRVTLDIRNMRDDMKKFMVDGIQKAHKVLLICTPRLKERASEPTKNNLQLELETAIDKSQNTPEFIVPLILSGSFKDMPQQVEHLLSINFTSMGSSSESEYYNAMASLAPTGLIPMLLGLEADKDYRRTHDRLFGDLEDYAKLHE